MRSLSRQTSAAFALQAGGVGLRYAGQVLLARWMGANAFGAYTYATNVAQVVANPCDLGGASSGMRFVPQYETEQHHDLLAGVVRTLQVVPVVLGTIVAAIAIALSAEFGTGGVSFSVMAISLATVPLLILSDVQTTVARGFHHIAGAFGPPLVIQPILVTGAAGAGLVAFGELTAPQASLLTAVALFAVVAIQTAIVHGVRRSRVPRVRRRYAPREWLQVSLPMLLTNVVQLVAQRLDVVMVGVFLGAKAAGVYAVAFRTAGLVSLLQTAINATAGPRMSHLHWA
ncbi:MAG: oligosaccharide flippase family protein, partial [Acidimicrobiales bacterium]